MSELAVEPFALPPGDGLAVGSPIGGMLTFKVRSDDSGGLMTAAEAVAAAGGGPPLHVHPEQDELIYTLEGTFQVRLADDVLEAAPGSTVFIPRATPHTWRNVGDAAGRFVFTLTPGAPRFEEFFVRYDELPPEERGVEAFARLATELQAMEVVGPPLGTTPQ